MQKVLIITYYWPPGSGAGVQRWLKFAKYLPEFGWEPVILTIDPEYATYPATDDSLEKDIPSGTAIFKTKATDYFRLYRSDKSKIPSAGFANEEKKGLKSRILRFVRGNFFIPDPRIGWNKYAFRKASEIIEKEGVSHVITTSPPHSTQLVGIKLKKKYPAIKWIADLRDPWTDIYYYQLFYHTPLARAIDCNFEKKVLLSSDRIITVGKSLKNSYSSKSKGLDDKIEVITNGYDEDDFKEISSSYPVILTVSYIGTLSDDYPLGAFLKAVSYFREKGNEIRLRFVGTVSPLQRELIGQATGSIASEFIPYVNHNEAIKYMADSTALLLVIPDHHSSKSIITGKLFEYLATRKPIICIGPPDGDAAEIISSSDAGYVFSYDDSSSVELFLYRLIKPSPTDSTDISRFSRKNLAKQLSGVLKKV